eukprot:2071852-Pleurochrysis_carterae.AAC.1
MKRRISADLRLTFPCRCPPFHPPPATRARLTSPGFIAATMTVLQLPPSESLSTDVSSALRY